MRATRDLTPDIRLIEIAPAGGVRSADARQPSQCRRADRRSSGRPLLFDRRPVRRWRLSHRRQAAEGHARRLRLYVDAGAGRASARVGARQSFRAEPRPARLSAARRRHRDHADVRPCAGARAGRRPVPHALRLPRAPRRRARRGARAKRIGDRLRLIVSEEGARVDIAAEIAKLDPQGEFYVCGPIGMLEDAKRAWARERTAGRQAALRDLRQQRPAPGRSFHGEDSASRQDDRRRRPIRPCSKRWRTPAST